MISTSMPSSSTEPATRSRSRSISDRTGAGSAAAVGWTLFPISQPRYLLSAAILSLMKSAKPASGSIYGSRCPVRDTRPRRVVRPRSLMTTRCGIPISSMSANITPDGHPCHRTGHLSRRRGSSFIIGFRQHPAPLRFFHLHRDQCQGERRNRRRPGDALLVVVLFDGRRPRDTPYRSSPWSW